MAINAPTNSNNGLGNQAANWLFPFILVTSLFFFWGFVHNLDPILKEIHPEMKISWACNSCVKNQMQILFNWLVQKEAKELKKVKNIRSLSFIQGTMVNFLRQVITFTLMSLIFKEILSVGQLISLQFYSFFIFFQNFSSKLNSYVDILSCLFNTTFVF